MKTTSRPAPAPLKPILRGKGETPDLHLATWMEGEVRYISSPSFHLVLYAPAGNDAPHPSIQPYHVSPKFKKPSDWHLLFHQTAGYACHHRYLHAKFLSPRPIINTLGKKLLEVYNDSLIAQPISLSTANEYNELLSSFGLTANRTYTSLEEGFYPIDIECLGKVTTEKFEKDLRKQLLKPVPRYKKRTFADLFSNWVDFELAILGPNCD
jgi:hypothetical protein